jgi:hypothetical protein
LFGGEMREMRDERDGRNGKLGKLGNIGTILKSPQNFEFCILNFAF